MERKKQILVLIGNYLPGYKTGGPVRSVKNITDCLGDEYEFKVLTLDRDCGDKEAYPNIKIRDWNQVGYAKVYYVPPNGFTYGLIRKLSRESDMIYMYGCFNDYTIRTLVLNRFGQIKVPVVVAAMGLFSPMAFRLKYAKKKLFVTVFNILGMFKHIYWSATSEMEISEICQQVNSKREQFIVAEDLPRLVDSSPIVKKKDGPLKIVWISRITPKKNLKGAIEILQQVKGLVKFTIYGPIYEKEYWQKCLKELEKLPNNVSWEYKGYLDAEEVVQTLKEYHVFLFPTFGENYGHVIQEALSAGCACVLSDQTPWQELEANGVGYVFAHDEKSKFVSAIEGYAAMTEEELQAAADRAHQYAIDVSNERVKNTGYRTVFDLAT